MIGTIHDRVPIPEDLHPQPLPLSKQAWMNVGISHRMFDAPLATTSMASKGVGVSPEGDEERSCGMTNVTQEHVTAKTHMKP